MDWIKEGAEVLVVYWPGGVSDISVKQSTITRVTATYFAVDGVDKRFRLRDRCTTSGGSSSRYEAYAVDDPQGQRLLARYNRVSRIRNAEHYAYRWQRNKTHENRQLLMQALHELDRYEDL